MNNEFDQNWRELFHRCVAGVTDEKTLEELNEVVSEKELSPEEWTSHMISDLEQKIGEKQTRQILSACACQYPKENLVTARQTYDLTGSNDAVLDVLEEQFHLFLEKTLDLDESQVAEVKSLGLGMGMAGVRRGQIIYATKFPKSGNLKAWFAETDAQKKAALYCHCPRVNHLAGSQEGMSPTYCYCGAGFYKGLWEEIIQAPVEMEVPETVQHGGTMCRIDIHVRENHSIYRQL